MEQYQIGLYGTLTCASLTLFIGHLLLREIPLLRRFTIPAPVVGGLVVAITLLILYKTTGLEVGFDGALQNNLLLAFFATIGLNANIASLREGGRPLFRFLFIVVGLLMLQNGVGLLLAKGLGEDPLLGLLAGSITLSGGHSTGLAWADTFSQEYGLNNAHEIAMACATFGLILGGLIGGPVVQFLLRGTRSPRASISQPAKDGKLAFEEPANERSITSSALLETIAMISLSLLIGTTLARYLGTIPLTEERNLTIPPFLFVLFVGAIINNLLALTERYRVFDRSVSLVGNVSLSLFLAIALMSLKLWQLIDLAIPIFLILAAQTLLMALYAIFITYPLMGRNYDAAVLAAGHCGFSLGATPTAIANMQAVTERFGPSRLAFLIVPLVGAFFIDLANALVINLFMFLPF